MFFRGQIIGKYKILSTIGSGGFGTVYLAEDTWIDKRVALKVPHFTAADGPDVLRPGVFTGVAVAFGVVTTLVVGIVPEPLLSLANQAASHLFVR